MRIHVIVKIKLEATIRILTHQCDETSFIHKKIQIKNNTVYDQENKLMTNVIKGNDRLVVNQIN